MATARIVQTIRPDGTVTTSMSVSYDVLDNPEALEQCVEHASVLWYVTQGDDGDDEA